MKQITIKNIAQELNLSFSTVSRALNDHPDIQDSTKDLVRKKAKELGYRPNFIARNLKSNKSDQIGVIVPEIRHDFFANVISGIEEVAYKKGYVIIIAQSNEEFEREKLNINSMHLHRVSGILASISQTTVTSNHFKKLIDQGVKIVFFDRVCEDLEVPKITIDDYASAYNMTKYLIEKGYKKIIHFAGPQSLSICQKRKSGYLQALQDFIPGSEPLIFEGGMHEDDGYSSAAKIIELGLESCAVFAVNDPVAVGAVKKIKEAKLDIPGQIGIAGFSNNPITELISPKITTIAQPAYEMGKKAAEILISEIENNQNTQESQNIKLNTELIIRESA